MSDISADLLDTWRHARLWVHPGAAAPIEIAPAEIGDRSRFPEDVKCVHFLSAWNPRGQLLSTAENVARHGELTAALAKEEVVSWPAAGYSTDGSWVEHGLALPDSRRSESIGIASDFGQLAIYEWLPDSLAIIECGDGSVTAAYRWRAVERPRPPERRAGAEMREGRA